jgi:hypothetical protein
MIDFPHENNGTQESSEPSKKEFRQAEITIDTQVKAEEITSDEVIVGEVKDDHVGDEIKEEKSRLICTPNPNTNTDEINAVQNGDYVFLECNVTIPDICKWKNQNLYLASKYIIFEV